MDTTIARLNIAHYRDKLATEKDETKRQTLLRPPTRKRREIYQRRSDHSRQWVGFTSIHFFCSFAAIQRLYFGEFRSSLESLHLTATSSKQLHYSSKANPKEVSVFLRSFQNVYPWFESVTLRGMPPKDPNDDDEEDEEDEENEDEQDELAII